MLNIKTKEFRRWQNLYPDVLNSFLLLHRYHGMLVRVRQPGICVCVYKWIVHTNCVMSSRTSVSNRGRPDDFPSAEAPPWNFHGVNDGHQLPAVCRKRWQHLAPPLSPVKSGQAVQGIKTIFHCFPFALSKQGLPARLFLPNALALLVCIRRRTEMTNIGSQEKRLETEKGNK